MYRHLNAQAILSGESLFLSFANFNLELLTKKSYISLAVKNALMYLVIITLSSFIIGYTIYRLSAVLIVSSAKKQLNEEVKGIAQNLTEAFDQIGRDVQFLAQSPVISSYLSSSPTIEAAQDRCV